MVRVLSLLMLIQVSGIVLASDFLFGQNDVWSSLPRLVDDDFDESMIHQDYESKQCMFVEGGIRLGDHGELARRLDMRDAFELNAELQGDPGSVYGTRLVLVLENVRVEIELFNFEGPVLPIHASVVVKTNDNKQEELWTERVRPEIASPIGRWQIRVLGNWLELRKDGKALFSRLVSTSPVCHCKAFEIHASKQGLLLTHFSVRAEKELHDRLQLIEYAKSVDLRAARAAWADFRFNPAAEHWSHMRGELEREIPTVGWIAILQMQLAMSQIQQEDLDTGFDRLQDAWVALVNAHPGDHPHVIVGAAILRDVLAQLWLDAYEIEQPEKSFARLQDFANICKPLSWTGKESLLIQHKQLLAELSLLPLNVAPQLVDPDGPQSESSQRRSLHSALVQYAAGDVDSAARTCQRALGSSAFRGGVDGSVTRADLLSLWACSNWMQANFDRERWQNAIQTAHKIYDTKLPAGHPHFWFDQHNLACLQFLDGQWLEAEKLCIETIEIISNDLGPNAPETLRLRRSLAMLRMSIRDAPEWQLNREQEEIIFASADLLGSGYIPRNSLDIDVFNIKPTHCEHPSLVMFYGVANAGPSSWTVMDDHDDSLALARFATGIQLIGDNVGRSPWRSPRHRVREIMAKLTPEGSVLRLVSNWLFAVGPDDEMLHPYWKFHPWSVWVGKCVHGRDADRRPPEHAIRSLDDQRTISGIGLYQTLESSTRIFGAVHPETADCHELISIALYNSGMLEFAQNSASEASRQFSIQLGETHPRVLANENTTAILEYYQRKLIASYKRLKSTVLSRREILGPRHLETLRSLSDFAVVCRDRGEYGAARRLLELTNVEFSKPSVQAVRQTLDWDRYARIASVNLAVIQAESGDFQSAKESLESLLGNIRFKYEKREILLSLASIATMASQFEQALQYLQELQTNESIELGDSKDAELDHRLGVVFREMGDFKNASKHLTRSLSLREQAEWDAPYELGDNLISLGILQQQMGALDEALKTFQYAEQQYLERLGDTGLRQADVARRISLAAHLTGDRQLAIEKGKSSLRAKLDFTQVVGAELSEAETGLLTGTLTELDPLLSSLDVDSGDRASEALQYVWLRKAVLAHMTRQRYQRVRTSSDPQVYLMFEELRGVRKQIATILGPQFRQHLPIVVRTPFETVATDTKTRMDYLVQLKQRKEKLERSLASLVGNGPNREEITVQQVAKRMPERSVLLEFVKANHWSVPDSSSGKTTPISQSVYYLFVVKVNQGQPVVTWHRFGSAKEIDSAVESLRLVVSHSSAGKDRGDRRIDNQAWDPEEQWKLAAKKLTRHWLDNVADCDHIYIVPDGLLHGLPWAALPGLHSKYLIEEVSLSLHTRGAALFEESDEEPSHKKSALNATVFNHIDLPTILLVGDVDYGLSDRRNNQESGSGFVGNQSSNWPPLAGAAADIRSINSIIVQHLKPQMILGGSAREQAVASEIPKHRFVHFATHGYFENQLQSGDETVHSSWRDLALASVVNRNPLARCGLVLANANQLPKYDSDGIPVGDDGKLTGEEIAGMNLSNVELMVFSACETALGNVADQEHIAGLHLAASNAGVGTTIGSLWKVDDAATNRLMTLFYGALLDGQSPCKALRSAQKRMIHSSSETGNANESAPYFWAGFATSLSGDASVADY